MKIEQAIEILSDEPETIDFENDPTALDALKLGIEALKRVKEDEYRGTEVPRPLLPGETQ